MAKLELRNLSMKYQQQTILSGLNLIIEDGASTVLLGESGCGKTTLLKIIAGIIDPESGEILMDGKSVTHISPQYRNIGLVPQSQVLFPHMTIRENVTFGLNAQKLPKDAIQEKLAQMTALTEIGDLLERYPSEISGGQKQRVALARAMAVNPQILLLDEPLSNIDMTNRETLALMIKKIQQDTQTTVLYVTHNQEEARLISDQVAIISNGKIQQQGQRVEIERSPYNFIVGKIIGLQNLWAISSCTDSEGRVFLTTALGEFSLLKPSKQITDLSAVHIPPNVIHYDITPPKNILIASLDTIQKKGIIFAIYSQNSGNVRLVVELQHQQYRNYLKIETVGQKANDTIRVNQDVWISFSMADIHIF